MNQQLRVTVSYTDDLGALESLTSDATIVTGDFLTGTNGGNTLNGTQGQDVAFGNGGGDTLSGFGEDDELDGGAGGDTLNGGDGADTLVGGAGNDTINAGDGDDKIFYAIGQGRDTVNGGAGADTLAIAGGAGNDNLNVVYNGAALTTVENGAVSGVETITADLQGATDTLTYSAASAGVIVDLAAGTATGLLFNRRD